MINTGVTCTTIQSISQPLYTPEQVREHESLAAEHAGITMWQLMERAGQAVINCLRHRFPIPVTVGVLCGSGNNGGDGYVVATLARQMGYDVRVFANQELNEKQSLEAALALNLWLETGSEVESFADWEQSETDVVVDALLGSGLKGDVGADLAHIIEQLNKRKIPVISVDVPSGLNANTGQVQGCAVKAAHTISFVGMKRGLYTGAARDYCGQLWFADLGLTEAFRELTKVSAWRLEARQLKHWLAPRAQQSNKGDFGHLLIIGGQRGMTGALQMAGEAALRSGAGKVTIVCEPGQEGFVAEIPELMVLGLDLNNIADATRLDLLIAHASHIAIGPGLGQSEWGQSNWLRVLESAKPVIVDADALNLLAVTPLKRDNWVLTPHPGEAARLLGISTEEVQANRWQSVKALQEKYGGTVVLKGSGSLVQGTTEVGVCAAGTPALASAGTGDILTGIVGGLMAQSDVLELTHWEAAAAGVLVHALAGETAAHELAVASRKKGAAPTPVSRGMRASDLLPHIVKWVNPNEPD